MNIKRHKMRIIFIRIFSILLGLIFLSGGIFYFKYKDSLFLSMKNAKEKIAKIDNTTFIRTGATNIYDKDNSIINSINPFSYKYIELSNIPNNVQNAFISIEDKDYYNHNGYSIKGMSRAVLIILKSKGHTMQGGSTITQQLVKNVLLTNKQTMNRKFEELFISKGIEKKFSKKQILEYYLNNIYFANGAYGIETASNKYFSKPANKLTLSESAFLAAIPNNPSLYNPLTNYKNTIDRRNVILKSMLENDKITEPEYRKALEEKISIKLQKNKPIKDDFVTSFAIDNTVRYLMKLDDFQFKYKFNDNKEKKEYEKKFSEVYTEYDHKVRSGGYNIYTTIDSKAQKLLQNNVSSGLTDFDSVVQGAGVTIDNSTGKVTAIVGGRNPQDKFNRAFLSYRQPGSAIKPILAYAPALENGYFISSIVNDSAIPNGPANSDRSYRGNVNLRYALARSINTTPFKLLDDIGPKKALEYLYNMKFKKIAKEDNNPIIGVGGFTYGTSPVEMASAYASLANNGKFTDPDCLKSVKYKGINEIYHNENNTKQVYEKEIAYIITDVLKDVLDKPFGTGKNIKLSRHIAAGKTGTTDGSKDGWFCGYTPYYTTAIWVGADTPQSIGGLYGATYPGQIWKNYMDKLHESLPNKDFTRPKTVVNKYINPGDGSIANYNTGVSELFSQPILDRIEEIKRKKAAELEKRKESERQENAKKLLLAYEKAEYVSLESLEDISKLMENTKNSISLIKTTDKKQELERRFNKKYQELLPDKQKYEALFNIKKQEDEKAAETEKIKQNSIEIENRKNELENRTYELQQREENLRRMQEELDGKLKGAEELQRKNNIKNTTEGNAPPKEKEKEKPNAESGV
ncbi:penicillin-binding protein (plasmid) [Clostridium botulinum A2B3 87]|nr:penicillin-binding protein [Clostridium botulinum A2B3 87]